MATPQPGQTQTTAQIPLRYVWILLIVPPILLGMLIVAYAGLSGAASAGGQEMEAAIRSALPYIILVNHTLLFALLLYLVRKSGHRLRDIGWRIPARSSLTREIASGLAIGVGLYLFKEFAIDSVDALLSGRTPTFYSVFNFTLNPDDIALMVAGTTLVFIEESIYRGVAIPSLRTRYGLAGAIAISSLAFGFLHWGNGLFAIAVTSVSGVFLGGVFLWRRNLIVGTVAHALYNLLVLLT